MYFVATFSLIFSPFLDLAMHIMRERADSTYS